MIITCYDLEDNLIIAFDNEEDCSKYFGISVKCLRSYLSRVKSGELDKKKNKYDNKWYRIYKYNIKDEENEDYDY